MAVFGRSGGERILLGILPVPDGLDPDYGFEEFDEVPEASLTLSGGHCIRIRAFRLGDYPKLALSPV